MLELFVCFVSIFNNWKSIINRGGGCGIDFKTLFGYNLWFKTLHTTVKDNFGIISIRVGRFARGNFNISNSTT